MTAPAPPTGRRSLLIAWAALMALTALSWSLAGSGHAGLGVEPSTALIVVLTFVKVLVVGYVFMELHRSVRRLRTVYTCWCATACAVIVALYLLM
ncbi:cytochrome C oxidase subunit IV family protein [Streptomyces qinglanensis]|uniref:Cytochrome C oxidase subunit IV n=1 Tax=Streptomyces qinglanensis TaxID=943816 RepID=A0A1H9QPZ8_9ACTN|nr:cytochrome C oxidase subunit IV family protein [Streptomyces qinglanensis]SER62487.1 Cytochrome C oxidase subunit IV [Streptomyces qinglanensis]